MATILDLLTLGSGYLAKVDGDPGAGLGTQAPIGTIAQWDTGTEGRAYLKIGPNDTDWDRMNTYEVAGFVETGDALNLALYPNTENVVDDYVQQNGRAINVAIEPQPSRTSAIKYQIPNPGDTTTDADFVLTEGDQTINGKKTFNDDTIINGDLTVNGAVTSLESHNTVIKDKLITLNDGGPANSGGGVGFEVEENGTATGYFKTENDANPSAWLLKAPDSEELSLELGNMTANKQLIIQDESGIITIQDAVLTEGSVPFVDASGLLTEDNTGLFYDASARKLGVNTNTPAEPLHVDGNTLVTGANSVITFNSKTIKQEMQASVTTADASLTTLQRFSIPTDSVVHFKTTVVARKVSGAGSGSVGDGASFVREARYKNISGNVTVHNVQSSYTSRDVNSWNISLTTQGTGARVAVTGSANNTMEWEATTEVFINKV